MTEPEKKAYKSWVFTHNNWSAEHLHFYKCMEGVNRLVVGEEVGESGTAHLQGVVTFSKPKRLAALKKLRPEAHWEVCKSLSDAINYCKKEGKFHEVGNSKQGDRTDLKRAYELVKSGSSVLDVMETLEPSYQVVRCMELYQKYKIKERPSAPRNVIWCYGPPGSGKSRWAHETFPGAFKLRNQKWWDGYINQDVVIIDDFRPDFCKFTRLLELADAYHVRAEIKGGTVDTYYNTLVITTPYPPDLTFQKVEYDRFARQEVPATGEDLKQLTRRISLVKKFPADTDTDVEGNTSSTSVAPEGGPAKRAKAIWWAKVCGDGTDRPILDI